MAVEDHPVHPRTQIDDTFRWGCHNRPPFAEGYWAPDRVYLEDGSYIDDRAWILHTNTMDCQSRISRATDPHCRGCKHITEERS